MQVRGEVVMPSDEDISQILCRYFKDNNYLLVDAVRDIRTLFAQGLEHRSGRMSARLEIAERVMAGFAASEGSAEDSRAVAATAFAWADALIAESEKS